MLFWPGILHTFVAGADTDHNRLCIIWEEVQKLENNFYTDLATEARDVWQQSQNRELPGLAATREEAEGFILDVVEIRDEETAKELCKPVGKYAALELRALIRREENAFPRACRALAAELRRQLRLEADMSVLAVCLGNPDVTPDAVGPLAAEHILATRHLKETMPEAFKAFRPVAVLRTGVLGTTGVESAELAAAAVRLVKPDAVLAVDALAARETARLCRTVQISDAGIVPGSGVGNARFALDRKTMGVPVVAVGVPTVIDVRALCPGAECGEEMFVTPRDVDSRVRIAARLVGYAVNMALHDGITVGDIDMFLS